MRAFSVGQGNSSTAAFHAPGLIGQWTLDVPPATGGGPVLWWCVDDLWAALRAVTDQAGTVHGAPTLDQGERWLVEVEDPAGNRIGMVAPVRIARAQPMLAVRDVEASSRWYAHLLGLTSDHGGPQYERLLADGGLLVLQLHHRDVEHHRGSVISDPQSPVGNGAIVWFGDVSHFDAVIARAEELDATVVRPTHRNPPATDGNGPSHREIWLLDPDGYTVVIASPDGEAWHQQ